MATIIGLESNDIGGNIGTALGAGLAKGMEEKRKADELAMKQERARQLQVGIRNAKDKNAALALIGAPENKDLFEDLQDYMAVSKEVDAIFEPDGSKKRTEVYKRTGEGSLESMFINVGEDPPEGFVTADFLTQTRAEADQKRQDEEAEEVDENLFDIASSEDSAAAEAYLNNTGKEVNRKNIVGAIASLKAVKDHRTTLAKSFGLQVDPDTGDILEAMTGLGGDVSDGKEADRFGIAQQVIQELTFEGIPEGRAYNAAIRAARALYPEEGKPTPTVTKIEDSVAENNEAKFTPGQIYETPGYGLLVYTGKKNGEHSWVSIE